MNWCLGITGILLLAIAAGCRVAAFESATNDDEAKENSKPSDKTRQSGGCVRITIEGPAVQKEVAADRQPDERNKADPSAGPQSQAVAV